MLTWQQYTRPAQFRPGQGYTSESPCCGQEVTAGVGLLRRGATPKRCPTCDRLWAVSFSIDDAGEYFAYWRRQVPQPR